MRHGVVVSIMTLLASASLGLAQAPQSIEANPSPPSLSIPPIQLPVSGELTGQGGAPSALPTTGVPHPAYPGLGWGDQPYAGEASESPSGPTTATRLYARGEYLLWVIKDAPVPSLQAMLPFSATGLAALNLTTTFPNGNSIDAGAASGFRATAGYILDPRDCWLRVEASYFQLEHLNPGFIATEESDVSPRLFAQARSFVVLPTVVEQILSPIKLTLPAHLSVDAAGSASAQLLGGEVNLRTTPGWGDCGSIDFLVGFRYLRLDENLLLNDNLSFQTANSTAPIPVVDVTGAGNISVNLGGITPPPLTNTFRLASHDRIRTQNDFYGLQVGGGFELGGYGFFVECLGKIAVGGVHQVIDIDGATTFVTAQGQQKTRPGGLLTPGTSPIHTTADDIAAVPEFNLKVGYQVMKNLRLFVGYDILAIASVVRPGDQIGFSTSTGTVSLNSTPSRVRIVEPAFNQQDSTFWAQGVNCGVEFHY